MKGRKLYVAARPENVCELVWTGVAYRMWLYSQWAVETSALRNGENIKKVLNPNFKMLAPTQNCGASYARFAGVCLCWPTIASL